MGSSRHRSSVKEALVKRLEHFAANGCCISDHSLDYVMYHPATDKEVDAIFRKKMAGGEVTREEFLQYQTSFMLFMAKEYNKRNWVMQLHYGVKRNNNAVEYFGFDLKTV